MSVLSTGAFWGAAFERALKTFCQGILAVIGVGAFTPADVDWQQVLLGAAIAAGASILFSIVSSGVGNAGPSLSSEVLSPPAAPVPADNV